MSPFRYVVETITMIRKLYIGFSVVILSILIVIGYAYYNSLEESKMLEWNNHTYEVMREADVLLTSLVNMETGIRGYVVTGDLVFLAPYTNGEKEYQRSLQKIKYLTEDNPNQQSRIASLENEESHWEEYCSELIELWQQVRRHDADAGMLFNKEKMLQGKKSMDAMRSILQNISSEERELLKMRSKMLEQKKFELRSVLLTGGVLSIGLLGLIIPFLTLDLRARKEKEVELRKLNTELEHKVYERTQSLSDMNAILEEEVSERQAAEELLLENHKALMLSENRYRGLFDHMQKAFIYCRLITNELGQFIDAEILDVNRFFEKNLYCRAEKINHKLLSTIECTEVKIFFKWLEEFCSQVILEPSLTFEQKKKAGDKWYQIAAYSPEKKYVAILIADISESERAETEIKESRKRYAALMKQSSEAVLVIDFDTRKITEANDACLQVFGYSQDELMAMPVEELLMISEESLQKLIALLTRFGGLPAATRRCRHKDGSKIQLERVASLIEYSGKQLILVSYRDITEQQKLQAALREELDLAGVIQKSLLPPEYENNKVVIRTVFQPLHFVSGDFYSYKWSHSGERLHGFVLDVTGHGIATALHTSAVSSLLNEAMEREQGWTSDIFLQLNRHCLEYFPEHAFVAIIAFTFDFKKKLLTYVAGGINYIIACSQQIHGLTRLPGVYLGVTEEPDFEFATIPLQYGDTFYFMTDGIYDQLPEPLIAQPSRFESTVQNLKELVQDRQRLDDCSALCIQVKDFAKAPRFIYLSSQEFDKNQRDRIHAVLYEVADGLDKKLEIVLAEALNNALHYGTKVRLKIQKIGNYLIIRISDNGPGFLGNQALARFTTLEPLVFFQANLEEERGRGLGIITAWTDKAFYNKRGNEIMMIKMLDEGE